MIVPKWLAGVVVLWICAISAVAGSGFLRTSDSFGRLDDETDARLEASCSSALEARAEQEAMWVEILTNAGVDDADIDILRDGYAGLPTPPSCD